MSIEIEIQKIINKHSNLDPLSELETPTPLVKELAELFNKQKGKSDKWDKLNKEFDSALERFDEWTPRKRTPIEAVKFEEKILKLAVEYCEKVTLPSMDENLKKMCQRDFGAGFYKCYEVQSEIYEKIKKILNLKEEKEFEENKSVLDSFFENTNLESYIRTSITMHDYDNWDNGTYKGKMHEVMPHIMKSIIEHHIEFAEYLHKYYPNVIKPENYREVPIEKGRKWMNAFLSDECKKGTTEELYVEFLKHKNGKK